MYLTVLLTLALTLWNSALCQDNRGVNLIITPSTLQENLTNKLVANCSVPAPNVTNERLFSITIKKVSIRSRDEFHQIAILNAYDSQVHANNTDQGDLTYEGKIPRFQDTTSTNSFLTLTWNHPKFTQAGTYICEVEYFNMLNGDRPKVMVNASINNGHPHLADALSEITRVQDQVTELTKQVTRHSHSFAAVNRSLVLTSLGDRYLLSRPFLRNSQMSNAMCGVLGGYLAELNDPKELVDLQGLMTKFNQTNYNYLGSGALIGINQEIYQGMWIFSTHNHENATWVQVNSTPDKNCLALDFTNNWKMTPVPCYDNQAKVHFLCELGD